MLGYLINSCSRFLLFLVVVRICCSVFLSITNFFKKYIPKPIRMMTMDIFSAIVNVAKKFVTFSMTVIQLKVDGIIQSKTIENEDEITVGDDIIDNVIPFESKKRK